MKMKAVPQYPVSNKTIETLTKKGGAASTVLFLKFFRCALRGSHKLYSERLGTSVVVLRQWERAYGQLCEAVPANIIVEHCFTSIDLLQERLSTVLAADDNYMKIELLSGLFYLQLIGDYLEITGESTDSIFKTFAIGVIGKSTGRLKKLLSGPQVRRARKISIRPFRRKENVRIGKAAVSIGVKFETLHRLVRVNGIPLEQAVELCQ